MKPVKTADVTANSTALLTFRTTEAKRRELDQIAAALDRNRNWTLNQALENYLELNRWQLAEIDAGIAEADAGETVPAKEVETHIKTLIAKNKAKKAARSK